MSRRTRTVLDRLGFALVLALLFSAVLFPLFWIVRTSLISPTDLFADPPEILPSSVSLDSYSKVLGDPTFRRSVLNSLIIGGLVTSVCLIVGSMAAYAIARIEFPGRTALMTGLVGLGFFPGVAVLVPLFIQFRTLGLLNTYWAVVLCDAAFALPLCVWLMVTFFRELSVDLEHAARVDGASGFQMFRKVLLPLAAPGVATTAVLIFIVAWNEFFFARSFLFDPSVQPASVVIPSYASIHVQEYGAQAAASVLVTIPLALMVFAFQRRIVSGLTAGAVKG